MCVCELFWQLLSATKMLSNAVFEWEIELRINKLQRDRIERVQLLDTESTWTVSTMELWKKRTKSIFLFIDSLIGRERQKKKSAFARPYCTWLHKYEQLCSVHKHRPMAVVFFHSFFFLDCTLKCSIEAIACVYGCWEAKTNRKTVLCGKRYFFQPPFRTDSSLAALIIAHFKIGTKTKAFSADPYLRMNFEHPISRSDQVVRCWCARSRIEN